MKKTVFMKVSLMLLCLALMLCAFVACDKGGNSDAETSAQTSAVTSAQTSAETSADTKAETSSETSAETSADTSAEVINYEITQSELNALINGGAFKNLTANVTNKTYLDGTCAESATTYGVVKLANDSLYVKDQYTEIYLTSSNGSWFCVTNEGSAWYGEASEDPYYNVAQTPVFDYIFEFPDFSASLGEYYDFTYDAANKCYVRDLGVISGVYHMTVKAYFENGTLVKMDYIMEWSAESNEFMSVKTAEFSAYGTTVVTVPQWSVQ